MASKKKTTAAAPAAVVKNETQQPAADAVVVVTGQTDPLVDEAKQVDAPTGDALVAPAGDAPAGEPTEAKAADLEPSAPDAPAVEAAALTSSDNLSVTDVEFVEVVPSVYPKHVRFFNNSSTQIADTNTGVFLGAAGTHDMTFGDAEHEQSILESLEVTIAGAYVPRELVTVQTLHQTNEV